MAGDPFEPQARGGSEAARLPLDEGARAHGEDPPFLVAPLEAIGRYVLDQRLIRAAIGRPDAAVPWIVLGLAVGVAGLIGGTLAVVLALLVGLPALFVWRLLSARRKDRPSEPGSPLRLVLLVLWVPATLASMAVVWLVDAAAGNLGIVRIVGLAVVMPIAFKALQMIFRVR